MPPRKYRSQKRRNTLQQAMQLLVADRLCERFFGEGIFPRYAKARAGREVDCFPHEANVRKGATPMPDREEQWAVFWCSLLVPCSTERFLRKRPVAF